MKIESLVEMFISQFNTMSSGVAVNSHLFN